MTKIKFYNATLKEITKIFPLERWQYSIAEDPDSVVVVGILADECLNERICVELDNTGFDYEIFVEEDLSYKDVIERCKDGIAEMSKHFKSIDFGSSSIAEALKTLSEMIKEYGDH